MAKSSVDSQKSWLSSVKRELSKHIPDLTWDSFAKLAGVEPRALKTYRMPENSADYRSMPSVTRAAIEKLLRDTDGSKSGPIEEGVLPQTDSSGLLIPSLAALVIRLAKASLIEGRMISGTSRRYGSPVGLTTEDRKAMSALSRSCLSNGLPDYGAEIHNLLYLCTQPLGEWLKVPEVKNAGLEYASFIHAEEGIPTAEAEELAAGFTGMTAGIEEQLFAKFMEVIGRFPEESANDYYARAREFVVRHPICDIDDLKKGMGDIPAVVWIVIQQQFYEAVPASWAIGEGVPICDHCGNAMKKGVAGIVCRTKACLASHVAKSTSSLSASRLMRVSRGIRQYCIEPGIDELRLFDALIEKGMPAVLYPFRDRVDISVGETGIDLKTYVSPETLGTKFKRSIGGLAYYEDRWLVVPDWQTIAVPSYMDRLVKAMGRSDVVCLTVSQALKKLVNEGATNA